MFMTRTRTPRRPDRWWRQPRRRSLSNETSAKAEVIPRGIPANGGLRGHTQSAGCLHDVSMNAYKKARDLGWEIHQVSARAPYEYHIRR